MQRFKNILLVLGELHLSGPAAIRAVKLARSNSARLTIIDVLPTTTIGRSLQSFSEKMEGLQKDLVRQRQEELEEVVSAAVQDLDVVVKVLSGKPFLEIIRYVQEHNCDLVIKAVEKGKRIASMLFGSTDLRLLRKCPCPVWMVRPEDHRTTKKILAAIELESFDDENVLSMLNQQIIEIASSSSVSGIR